MTINDLDITKEDFKDLLKNIKFIRASVEDDNKKTALFMLETLEKHLENNLINDKEDREFKLYDKVKVISTDDHDLEEYVGCNGTIIRIGVHEPYIYTIHFKNPNLEGKNWSWRKGELQLL